MDGTRVSRVRVEIGGDDEQQVRLLLAEAVDELKSTFGSTWEIEREQVIGAKTGAWGFISIKRPS